MEQHFSDSEAKSVRGGNFTGIYQVLMILDTAESKKTAASSEISDESVLNVLVESGANQ